MGSLRLTHPAPGVPPGFSLRRPTVADARAVVDLLNAADIAEGHLPEASVDDLLGDWTDIDLAADAWIVERTGVRGAQGYVSVEGHGGVDFRVNLTVLPDARARGVGSLLLGLAEDRARGELERSPSGVRVVIGGHVYADTASGAWAERRGYREVRRFNQMTITLDGPPAPPTVVPGITVRTFEVGRDEQSVFASLAQSFADHWGSIPMSYDEWSRGFARTDFDPLLWYLALDGDEVVSTALGLVTPAGGWVRGVGTRRDWRRRGIARALMLDLFGAYWARGVPTIGLGVDSDSLTGALDLYLNLGMTVLETYQRMEKEVRPGRDPATRAVRPHPEA